MFLLGTAPKMNVRWTFRLYSEVMWTSLGRPLDVQTYFERPVDVQFRCCAQWGQRQKHFPHVIATVSAVECLGLLHDKMNLNVFIGPKFRRMLDH